MGLLTTSTSSAKVTGPILVSFVYDNYGAYFVFGGISIILILTLLVAILLYSHAKVRAVSNNIFFVINDAKIILCKNLSSSQNDISILVT